MPGISKSSAAPTATLRNPNANILRNLYYELLARKYTAVGEIFDLSIEGARALLFEIERKDAPDPLTTPR